MKGLDHDIAPVEQREVKEVREKDRYIASMKLNPGQSVFKYLDKKISIIGGTIM
jgi:acetoacetate decarboxylase